ncbi:tRNA (5-methylaminomethyl-2-thiouridine)(34)-methyltransferase MnmD [Butyricimonas synergistica]|uniref:tRNA (5-methylaminomethyl-2-thiouridine)(34)-methyltransferase MnmD n=1 Tax=Butyricimonas synergistica TaxID=544644 RepID=UPI00036F14EC|nr:tRNA (5-methylaminomethyl-2-thiouridine)(34)-methyltransferase MnmD [Butyricimonas synergistica]
MQRKIITTEDGSSTLYVPGLNEHYHSVHGAIQESRHIFIQAGIQYYGQKHIHILEAGFGTGLNAFLTLLDARENEREIAFHSFEKYPLTAEEVTGLNYTTLFTPEEADLFQQLHSAPWEENVPVTPYFTIHKHEADFSEVNFTEQFDIVFFDAFAPDVQPRLWGADILSGFYNALKPGGILVTYCVKGIVKQALREVGFSLKRLPGPPGKREMLRATK